MPKSTENLLRHRLFELMRKFFDDNSEKWIATFPDLASAKIAGLKRGSTAGLPDYDKQEEVFEEKYAAFLVPSRARQFIPCHGEGDYPYLRQRRELVLLRLSTQQWLLNNIALAGELESVHPTMRNILAIKERLTTESKLLFISTDWIKELFSPSADNALEQLKNFLATLEKDTGYKPIILVDDSLKMEQYSAELKEVLSKQMLIHVNGVTVFTDIVDFVCSHCGIKHATLLTKSIDAEFQDGMCQIHGIATVPKDDKQSGTDRLKERLKTAEANRDLPPYPSRDTEACFNELGRKYLVAFAAMMVLPLFRVPEYFSDKAARQKTLLSSVSVAKEPLLVNKKESDASPRIFRSLQVYSYISQLQKLANQIADKIKRDELPACLSFAVFDCDAYINVR